MKRKWLAVGIILLFVGLGSISSNAKVFEKDSSFLYPLENHAPIRIIGNDEFLPENGVIGGSGTADDPYIIENWVIVSDGSASEGIFINNTDAYFIIRNCTIQGFHHPDEFYQGIEFSEVAHGRIQDTNVNESAVGIYLRYSAEIAIENCLCFDYPVYPDGDGMYISRSTNISIVSSRCYNMRYGISLHDSSDILLQKTNCYNNTQSGVMSFADTRMNYLIEECSFLNNTWQGVYLCGPLKQSSHSIIRNCSFYDNKQSGMDLVHIWDAMVENCVFNHNNNGLSIYDRSQNNTVRNCSFLSQNGTGLSISGEALLFSFAQETEVSYCTFENNINGLDLGMVRNTKVHHCTITNSSFSGIFCFFSTPKMTQNNIYNNGDDWEENGSAGMVIWNSFCDLRNNWWGSLKGPSVTLVLLTGYLPLRTIPESDKVYMFKWFVIGFNYFRPWLSEPVPDAGSR
ncbi:MAG: right-handed parallel beta-helix repeat-containing protein [Candidatus Thermoplasmatota archaeon]